MRPNPLYTALALCLASAGSPAFAEGAAGDHADAYVTAAEDLDTIVVVATRSARAAADVANTVDRIERTTIDREQSRDLQDLFRYTPGVSVGRNSGRFGIGDIRIRGLGGNRVLLQTDGVPVGDTFAIGSFANANRDFVDPDTLKAVEVLRGPGSALYGSDALGGVIAFATRDPEDYLDAERRQHIGLRLGYDSAWNGLSAHTVGAIGGERWSGLIAIGRRQGQEQENQGDDLRQH